MNKRCDRKGWIHDTEENTLLLVWEREEIPISFKVHRKLASVLPGLRNDRME